MSLRRKLMMMLATLRRLFSISGLDSLAFFAKRAKLKSLTQQGKCVQDGTPTPRAPVDIVCNNGVLAWDSVNQRVVADGTPETITVNHQTFDELPDLLGVGDYKDSYDIVSGLMRHNVGVLVLDGRESWNLQMGAYPYLYAVISNSIIHRSPSSEIISHFTYKSIGVNSNNQSLYMGTRVSTMSTVFFRYDNIAPSNIEGITTLRQWLADQYAAGTPVIIVYPLATETTEQLKPISIPLQDGTTNITVDAKVDDVEITAEVEASSFVDLTNQN